VSVFRFPDYNVIEAERGVVVFPFSPESSSSGGIPTFSAEMAGAKALWLCLQMPKARASAKSNFGASFWWFNPIFDHFSQNSSKLYFCPRNRFRIPLTQKSHFRWFGVPQTLTNRGKPEAVLGGSFDRGWKTLEGSSIPENLGKVQPEMVEKLGAQFWGFKLLITPALSSTGKTLKTVDENLPFRHVHFLPILQASG